MSDPAIALLFLGMGVVSLIWGITELRSGRARFRWPGSVFSEEEDTLLYSIAVVLKLLTLPLVVLVMLST